jgi:hypothetical protein
MLPGYPEPQCGVAAIQKPYVFLWWLLKELWNYWIYVGYCRCSYGQVLAGGPQGSCGRGTCDVRSEVVNVRWHAVGS